MSKKDFAFNKENYLWVGISVALIIIGFALMSGGGSEDGVSFNPEIFSKRRIVFAPFVTVAGFVLMIFAILKTSKNKKEKRRDKMSWFEALILGIVQGLTEFLPVSSSGHLTIGSALFGINGEENLTFTIAVHAATVLSTLVILWKEVEILFRGLFSFKWNDDMKMVCKLLLSAVPIAFVGLFFKDYVEEIFGSGLLIVGVMLLLTAALLAFAYYAKPRQKEEISFKDALIIGLSQACAIFPGLSRSGTTIATGILLGDKKEKVAKFSFLMVIIPVMGETLLDLMKGEFTQAASGISTPALLTGFVAAFITGCLACKLMISIVSKGKLIYFSYYCIAAGLFAIIYSFI